MSQALSLDAGWPASTPAGVIEDCAAADASVALLYAINLSDPSAQKTAEFMLAVDQGVAVLPIVTPGNAPNLDGTDVLTVLVGLGLKHKFVAFDLERFSFPSTAWMASVIPVLHGAGWKVIGYGFQSTKAAYWPCGFDYWWGVIDYTQKFGYIPDWCDMFQFFDKYLAQSGATYDSSTIGDSLWAAFSADPAPPGGDDLTPDQAAQLTAIYNFLAGTGNTQNSLVQALYNWDAGTGNSILATVQQLEQDVAAIKAKVGA